MSSMNRRNFLKVMGCGTCAAAAGQLIRRPSDMVAYASVGDPGNILIVINMLGGCSYNIAPVFNGVYENRMGPIFPQNPLMISGNQGLHPRMTALKTLWDEGKVALYNGAGIERQARTGSHAEDQAMVQAGVENQRNMTYGGTGGRIDSMLSSNPWSVVSVAGSALFIEGGSNARAITGLGSESQPGSGILKLKRTSLLDAGRVTQSVGESFVRGQMKNFDLAFDTLRQYANAPLPVTFPNTGLGNSLRDLARLYDAGLGVKLGYATIGGFDTHSNELNALGNLAQELSDAMTAFMRFMEARGKGDKLTMVTMSEFGRTASKNDSDGTDHGVDGVQIVVGGNIIGGVKTPPPTADESRGGYFSMNHVSWNWAIKHAVGWLGLDINAAYPVALRSGPGYLNV